MEAGQTPPPPTTPRSRGRPWRENRPVLDAILWKIRNAAPWRDLPAKYPPHQTCYRRYRQWIRTGVFRSVLVTLYRDLRDRGGLDLDQHTLDKNIRIEIVSGNMRLIYPTEYADTWQLATALIYLQLAVPHIERYNQNPG